MRSTAKPAFAAEDLSVALLYYVEAKLERRAGGLNAARRQLSAPDGRERVSEILAAQLDLADPEIACELRQIPLTEGVDVSGVLACDGYRTRLLEVAQERLRAGADAPALRIAPEPWQDTAPGINFALIFGAETTLFQDTVLALQADEEACRSESDPRVNVLGVHHTWLDEGMRARRAIIVDQSRRACEVTFSKPQPIDVAETLHLPRRNEIALHRHISIGCEKARIAQINPYDDAAARADDKMRTSELWRSPREPNGAQVETPLARLVPRRAGREAIAMATRSLLNGRTTAEVVVQPNHGTEGCLVEARQVSKQNPEMQDIVRCAERILPVDDVLIREARGNVRFIRDGERRRIAFRVNVACDGNRFVAESGFAQVAADAGAFAASRGRGGEVVALGATLRSLCCQAGSGWQRISLSASDLEDMCATAVHAAGALNSGLPIENCLKHMGLDLVLEAHGSRVTPVLLEANARPAGLASSYEIQPSWHGKLKPRVTTALFGFVRQQRNRSRRK